MSDPIDDDDDGSSLCGTVTFVDTESDAVAGTQAFAGDLGPTGAKAVLETWLGPEPWEMAHVDIGTLVRSQDKTQQTHVAVMQTWVGTLEDAQAFVDRHRN